MDTAPDLLALDRTAVLETVRIVDRAAPDDWDRPTPCSDWTLRQLVAHMAGQHHGFAAAARGEGADLAAWQDLPLGDDPRAVYRAAAEAVLAAFAAPGVTGGKFLVPEISTEIAFPATVAIGFHFLDYVVHGWDVAAALGIPLDLPEETVQAVLPIARLVPNDARRLVPTPQFRPTLPPPDNPSTLDLVLTALGRSPGWVA